MYFPASVVAKAPHMAVPARRMILHPLAPHSLNATSSARAGEFWFQLHRVYRYSRPRRWRHNTPTAEEAVGPVGSLCVAAAPSAITSACRALSIAHEGNLERKV